MDIVYIRDLKIETVIGIFDWERRIRQTVSIDLEMATDRLHFFDPQSGHRLEA